MRYKVSISSIISSIVNYGSRIGNCSDNIASAFIYVCECMRQLGKACLY